MRNILSLILLPTLILLLSTGCSVKKPETPKETLAKKPQTNVKKLEYFKADSMLVDGTPPTLEDLLEEDPSAVGEFQPTLSAEEAAAQITEQALKAKEGKRALPLIAHWNTGADSNLNAMSPDFMISLIEQGHHVLPSWELDPYWAPYIPIEYYEDSIKRAAELGLPLVFISSAYTSALIEDSSLFNTKAAYSPKFVDTNGAVHDTLSPMGHSAYWKRAGENWIKTDLMKQIQEWYPNPPLVVFLSRNEAEKLNWTQLQNSERYLKQHGTQQTDEAKRKIISDAWFNLYRALQDGMKKRLTKEWSENTIFVGRNTFPNTSMGKTNEWMNDSTYNNGTLSVWPLIFDGTSQDFVIEEGEDDTTQNSPHLRANNMPFMLEDTKFLNDDFWWEATIGGNGILEESDRYRGFTQFDLWLNRPSVVREATNENEDNETIMQHFVELIDSVEMIHNSELLQEFWENGTLVKNPNIKHPYDKNIPELYAEELRWYMLDTDQEGVWAFALVKGEEPNREWLVFAQSGEGERSSVAINILEYDDVRFDVESIGSFYSVAENISDSTKRILRVSTQTVDLFVSTTGKPNASGSMENPFGTLEDARDTARNLKDKRVNVWLRGGIYALDKTFELTEKDSRSSVAPLAFKAWADENVTILGGKIINNWNTVTDENILSQLSEEARKNIKVANLKDLGLTEYGSPKGGGLELFHNGKTMTLSRWPNEGFTHIEGLVESSYTNQHGMEGSLTGEFYFKDARPLRWKNEQDVWLHGYWFWDWSEQRQQIEHIDYENNIILLRGKHYYGYRDKQWYYAYNLLSEIDQENEWFLDRAKGLLYFWPSEDIAENSTMASSLPTLINIVDSSNISFYDIDFSTTTATAITIENANYVSINNAIINNIGKWGVEIVNSYNSGVASCDISQTGDGGVYLEGGDRKTLTAGNLYAKNNHIHHYARINRVYKPAVSLNGVGNIAANNYIHDAPHMAIFFAGNDHTIEYNEIHNVVEESNDAGAVYGLRDWSQRGTIIKYNYFHHINDKLENKSSSIYLDDQLSGTHVIGNIFYKVNRPLLIGGGKDNVISDNIIIDSYQPVYLDDRGLTWSANDQDRLIDGLKAMPYESELWQSKYPELKVLFKTELPAPTGNIIVDNLFVNVNSWDANIFPNAKQYIDINHNTTQNIYLSNDSNLNNLMKNIENVLQVTVPYSNIGIE